MGIKSSIQSGLRTLGKYSLAGVALMGTCHVAGEKTIGVGCHDVFREWREAGEDPNTRINHVLDTGTSDAYETEISQPETDIVEIDNPTTVNTPTPEPEVPTLDIQHDIIDTPAAEPSAPSIRVIERQPVHFGAPAPNNVDPATDREDTSGSSQIMPPARPNRTVIRVSQEDCGEEPGRLRTQQRQAYQACLDRNRAAIEAARNQNSDGRVLPPDTL